MSDDAQDSLILRYLRNIDTQVGLLREDIKDLKARMSAVENSLNAIRRDLVALAETDARQQVALAWTG